MVNVGLNEVQIPVFILQQLRLLKRSQQEIEDQQRLIDKELAVLDSLWTLVLPSQLVHVCQGLKDELLVDDAEDVVSVHLVG